MRKVLLFAFIILQVYISDAQTKADFNSNRLLFFQNAIANNLSDAQLEKLLPDDVKEFRVHPLGTEYKLEGVVWFDKKEHVDEYFQLKLNGYQYLGTIRGMLWEGSAGYEGKVHTWINCSKELVLEITEAKMKVQVKLIEKKGHAIFGQRCVPVKSRASLSMPGWKWNSPPKANNVNDEKGLIAIEIIIDKRGNVISAKLISYSVSFNLARDYLREAENLTFAQITTETPPVMTTGEFSIIIE